MRNKSFLVLFFKKEPLSFLRLIFDRLAGRGIDLRPGLHEIRRRLVPAGAAPGLVSIILPTRNRALLIEAAIKSVIAQSYRNWELLIIDDGSTDYTAAVVRPYLQHRRIRYYRRKAAGAAASRNAGLRIARGDLVAYLDSDNDWDGGFLQIMAGAFAGAKIQSAYGMLIRYENAAAPETLFEPFDRGKLLQGNFIDINVFMHRRALFDRCGGFDETLKRLADWDLILRYSEDQAPEAVSGAIANYRMDAADRISRTELFYPAYRQIRAKWRCPAPGALRVLYVVWQFPQVSEMYIEAEMQAMRRLGVHIEVWAEVLPSAPYPATVPVHRATLAEAVAAMRPDVVHVHWLNIAAHAAGILAPLGLPVTVRGHSFDVGPDFINKLLAHEAIRRVYLYPHQIEAAGIAHPKLAPVNAAFETTLFGTAVEKDRRLVLRASAALPSKELGLFLQLATLCPAHRFVLAVASCTMMEHHIGQLLALRRELNSPAQILLNVPHEEIAALMSKAGIYLHTALPPEQPPGTALGMPISIAEAMASGCVVITRNLPPYTAYTENAGLAYDNLHDATARIAETMAWSDEDWRAAATRAVERAWTHFTGDDDFYAIREDWIIARGVGGAAARQKRP